MDRSTRSARSAWRRALLGACGLALCLTAPAAAQYTDPGTTVPAVPGTGSQRLVGVGHALPIGTTGFRLTSSIPWQRSGVWLINKQPIAGGFQTTFQFRITNPGGIVQYTPFGLQRGGDGFAFVIQNYGIPVVGPPAGYLGYHGLPNSLAIEFDTWLNYEAGFFDPNFNHISVHTRGVGGNSVSESASLGRATALPFLKDGAIHVARIDYTPGTLRVFVDNLALPVLTIPGLNLSNVLRLDNGAAWVGFTAGTGNAYETHDIHGWQFGAAGFPLVDNGSFPVTPPPTTTTPTTPSDPYVLPPPTTGTTNPPFNFPPGY